jgi:ankyrin repeat protein
MALRRPVRFVRAKASGQGEEIGNHERDQGPLTGDEAMTFYQDILSTTTQQDDVKKPCSSNLNRKRRKSAESFKSMHSETLSPDEAKRSLLYGSQHGDEEMVRKAINSGCCDLNCVDSFHWTALMCACKGGHSSIVRRLLHAGASWRDILDKSGRNALDLAQLGGFSDIVLLLLNNGEEFQIEGNDKRKRRKLRRHLPSYWCSECTMDVADSIRHKHKNSTVHQFSCRHGKGMKPGPNYMLRHSNVGYQMMLRDGWSEEKGLGAAGQGRWYPIKTVLKRDRKGFGAMSDSPRVTHFGSFDDTAVDGSGTVVDAVTNQMTKKQLMKNHERERQLEINFRRSFNTVDM